MNINHVALSVPDLTAAVTFYSAVFGFQRLRPDQTHDRASTPNSPIFAIYGDTLQTVKVAYLGSGNSVGFEIFEFVSPAYSAPYDDEVDSAGRNGFVYHRGGFYHVAVTVDDVDAIVRKVIEHGGKQLGKTVEIGGGKRAAYVGDVWGNVVELLDVGFEELCAAKKRE